MNQTHAALSAIASIAPPARIALRATLPFTGDGFEVDEKNFIIRGAAVMKIGPAVGHGFSIDAKTLQQVATLGNEKGQVKIRFKHPAQTAPGMMPDDLGDVIGYVDNLRVVGDAVRGDVHLEDYAEVLPGLGDVRTYLLRRAKSSPQNLGLSCVIGYEIEPVLDARGNPGALVARVNELDSIDFVGRGAATPDGLLAAKPPASVVPATAPVSQPPSRKPMNPKIKAYMVASLGLAADATDEAAQTAYLALSVEDKAKADAAAATKVDPAAVARLAAPIQAVAQRIDNPDEDAAFLAREEKRRTNITALGTGLKIGTDVISLSIANNDSVQQANARFLAALAANTKPITHVAVGVDQNIASLSAAIPDALRMRAGVTVAKPHDRATQLTSQTILNMGRNHLAACGVSDAFMMGNAKVMDMLFRPQQFSSQYAALAQSTGSFLNLTLDAINKTLRQAYMDSPANWPTIFRRGTNPDFKAFYRVAMSDAPGLAARAEGGEIKYGVMSDGKESATLVEYTSGIRLTRQAIINDDLSAFGRIPMLQGSAAKRKEDDVAFAILTANAALADSTALFDVSTHKNYSTATAEVGAPSVSTLAVGRKLLRKATGPKGAYLNLIPKFLVVPAALESVAEQYTSANYTAAISTSINPFATNGSTPLRVVVEPRLDANSAVIWYLLADVSQIDTVEVTFLADEPEPVLKQEVDFETDDVKFAVRHTVVAKAIDYRGMYANAGA